MSELHQACERGDWKEVTFLLNSTPININTQNRKGETPLHIASKYDDLDTIKILISREECNLNIADAEGNTPLHTACKQGQHSTVQFLVADQRCQLNAKNGEGETPLHIASEHGDLDTVKVLASRNECDINIPDERGNTPLHLACYIKALSIAKLLLEQRCNTNNPNQKEKEIPKPLRPFLKRKCSADILNKKGETAQEIPLNEDGDCLLHIACQWNDAALLRYLINSQACNPNITNTSKYTPLHTACKQGHLLAIKILVGQRECDLNFPDERGNTPLHTACKYGHHSIVQFLVADQRCQLNTPNREGETPLNNASECGRPNTVKVLVSKRECDLNIPDVRGNTPLHTACKHGHHSTVKILVADQRCQLNTQNREGETPLNKASECGRPDTVKVLVSKRECDLNIPDVRGNTPLHTACKHGHHSTVEILVADQRCQLNTQNREGETPLYITSEHGNPATVKVLASRKDCDFNIAENRGNTPLHTACKHGHRSTVVILVADQRCQLNTQNREDETPLNTASEHGHSDIVRVLLSRRECKLNIPDDRGDTPLHTACKHGHHSTVEILVADLRCQLNATNNDMNTPMHIVCINKELSVVKLLLEMRCSTNVPNKKGETAQEIPLSEDGGYLLHKACQWGDADIVKYLVTDQRFDPNVLNKSHMTPLLAAIKHGNASVVTALLQHAKCDLSLCDQAGNTALHLACISGQSQPEMVKVAKKLIVSADPLCVNSAGQTPTELTTNYELIQAISHFTKCKTKHSVQTYINIFIVGNPETGKTTLVKAICKEAKHLWRMVPKNWRLIKNVPLHTAGIIPTTFQSKTFGNTVLYDLAGQIEYYTSHAAVIQTTVISTPPAFIIVVNMSESEEKISETLRYWWSFINNHASRVSAPPQVILVCSHADIVESRGGIVQEKMSQVSLLLKRLPISFHFAGQVALDCRDPASSELQFFCSMVDRSCTELRQMADVDLHCHALYAFLLERFPDEIACAVSHIATIIKENDALLPQNLDDLLPLISTLSDKGLLLLVRDSVNSGDGWVILERQKLLGEVNGIIFAPKHFIQHKKDLSSSTGVVPLLKLKSEFPDYNHTMIAKFLTHLEFCFKIDDHETLELLKDEVYEENMPQNLSEEYYFFPALVSIENPLQVWEQDDVMISQCGWFYQCINRDQFLTTQFLHVLILRLAFSFALKLDPGDSHQDSIALHRRCSVWKHGIGWLNREPIETVVEVGLLKQSVIVMMRCPKSEEVKCTQLRSEIIQKVLEVKDEHCKAVKMSESFIHPTDIKYPFFHCAEELKYYSLSEIARATVKGAANVLDCRGRNPFPMKDLLLFDPQAITSMKLLSELFSEKHSLDGRVRRQVLQMLLEATPRPAVTQDRGCVGATTQEFTQDDVSRHSNSGVPLNSYTTPHTTITQQQGQVGGAPQDLAQANAPQQYTKPTLPELLKFTCTDGRLVSVPVEIATKYVQFGTFLLDDTNGSRVKIMARKHHYDAEQINIEILQEWLIGRGKQPVTWNTLIKVLNDIELSTFAGDISTSKPSEQ